MKILKTKRVVFWWFLVVVVNLGFVVLLFSGALDDRSPSVVKRVAEAIGQEPPNLYELARQTAENTRHIFWLIVVCFAAWSFRSYKTGK
jgi:hypothetical protein